MLDLKKIARISKFALVPVIVIAGVAAVIHVRSNRKQPESAPAFLNLTDEDRRELKTELEKVVREDLIKRKATKINSVDISDPEQPDPQHLVMNYEFSYDDASEDQGAVTHNMKAAARLERIQEGWQIQDVTPNDESLKFTTPLVIESMKKSHAQ